MQDTAIAFQSDGLRLAGTVTMPTGHRGSVPAVLLVSGSGPLDRDGNHKRLRLDIQRHLAVALAGHGIASLRYDKRGVGDSDGVFLEAGLHDNVDDAAAAFEALREHSGVDASRVFIAGHSEGAIIAAALAARTSTAAGVVLLSPTARRGEDLLLWQARTLTPTLPTIVRLILRMTRTDLVTKVARNHDAIRRTVTDVARLGGRRINARWLREFLAHDPREDYPRIAVPVLALTGRKDLQTPADDVTTVVSLVAGEAQAVIVDDVSHILRTQDGRPTLQSYRRDSKRPIDERVSDHVTSWIRRVAGAPIHPATTGRPDV